MLEFKNKQAESMIVNAVDYARAKHPYFASDLSQALLLAQEELGEAIKAFNGHVEAQHEMRDYSYKDVLEELSHCAAVIIRTLDLDFVHSVVTPPLETGVKPK